MSSSAALRPGTRWDLPQREDLRDGWLDRTAAPRAVLRQRAFGRSPGHAEFLQRVDSEARELGA